MPTDMMGMIGYYSQWTDDRFGSFARMGEVLGRIAMHYGEDTQALTNPEANGLTDRQATLVAAVLGMNATEYAGFLRAVRTDRAARPPVPPEADPLPEIRFEGAAHFVDLDIRGNNPADEKTPRPPSQPPAEGENKGITFPILGARNGIRLVKDYIARGIRFPQMLKDLRIASGAQSDTQFCELTGLKKHQYERLRDGTMDKPPLAVMNRFAASLGVEKASDIATVRKYMLRLPPAINQTSVTCCFDPAATRNIESDAWGARHTVALARFYELLMDANGLVDRGQLATAIAEYNGLDAAVAKQILTALNNSAGNIDNAGIKPENAEAQVAKGSRPRTLNPAVARPIAVFAAQSQEEEDTKPFMELLTHPKHLTPEKERAKRISATHLARHAARKAGGDEGPGAA